MRHTDVLIQFFGWYTAVNIAVYLISVAAILTMRNSIVKWSGRRFGLPEEEVLRVTFRWVAAYKLGIMMFAIAPWLALTFMA